MRFISNKNLGVLVASLVFLSNFSSCKKDNLEYNTNYVWKTFGGVEYYYDEKDNAQTNILGLKNIPEIKGEIKIYDFNNNNRFDYDPTAFYKDGAEVSDSIEVGGGKKIFLPVNYLSSSSKDSSLVNEIMQKYLPILKDSLAKQN